MNEHESPFSFVRDLWRGANYGAIMLLAGVGLYEAFVPYLGHSWALGVAVVAGVSIPLNWKYRGVGA